MKISMATARVASSFMIATSAERIRSSELRRGIAIVTDTIGTVLLVAGLSLLPLLLVVLSSFAKIAIVLTILRNAIGANGVPPNLVITGLSMVLTAFVLVPVFEQVVDEVRPEVEVAADEGERDTNVVARAHSYAAVAERAGEPIRRFLERHAHKRDVQVFAQLAGALHQAARDPDGPGGDQHDNSGVGSIGADDDDDDGGGRERHHSERERDFLVLAPAFVTSELAEAFMIGVLVLMPFLVIDLVVASVLLSVGMSSLPVAALALPLKLLLFVMVDGWRLLMTGLVAGYV